MPKSKKSSEPRLSGSNYAKAEASAGFLFWRAFNKWSRLLRVELEKIELTQAQYSIMAATSYLGSAAEFVTQQDVARQLSMDKMMVSDVTKTLEKKKILVRKSHPHDGRSFALQLTQAGQSKLKQAVPIIEGVDERFFSTLKSEQLKSLAMGLAQLGAEDN